MHPEQKGRLDITHHEPAPRLAAGGDNRGGGGDEKLPILETQMRKCDDCGNEKSCTQTANKVHWYCGGCMEVAI